MKAFDAARAWFDAGVLNDVPRLGSRVVVTPIGDVAIFRTASDEVFALKDRCPHKGGPLSQGIVHGRHVTCPLHNWVIELDTGKAVAPDKGCSPPVRARLNGSRIELDVGPRKDVRTTCPYCGVGCGLIAGADGGLRGDPAHPANTGRLCSKGSALGDTLQDGERLLQPRIAGKPASWDNAVDLIARRFQETIAAHGPESVAFYVSGQLLTEDYYVANKLMKGFIGAANIDTNSRLCMASSVAGHVRAFGADVVPGIYDDFEEADLVVLVGSNTAWCHPVLFQRLTQAKAVRGTRIVTIDPRRTATCEVSDLHLSLSSGTDVALFNGLLVHLADNGCVDTAWAERHTVGFEEALRAARDTSGDLGQVAERTGLSLEDITTFYEMFAATAKTVTVYSQGVNQSSVGTDKVNAIINCHLATGRIGRPGTGPFSVTGQPNAMGGREVGGLANQLAAHMTFQHAADIDRVRRYWNAPRMATQPGLKAVQMFDAVKSGKIKALWIMATNPAASMPHADEVRDALEACPFVVVSDCWDTDTTRRAAVVLPAAAWGEKDGTVTNSERRISRQRAFRAIPGEARPDWRIVTEVARRMGWHDAFPYASAADIFREHAGLSGFENQGKRAFDISALKTLSNAAYEALEPVRWPLPANTPAKEAGRLFADGGFLTDDGRARFVTTAWRAPAAQVDTEWPLLLNTGRLRDQWHTMTRTGRAPHLMAHAEEPFLAIHPQDAAQLGIATGNLVRCSTPQGDTVLPALLSEEQRQGEVFAPMHWTDEFVSTGPIGRIVSAACDPISGQPELKATPAHIEIVPTMWRGVLLTRRKSVPRGEFYCARIPLDGGQAFHLAGWEPLPAGDALRAWGSAILDAPPGAERIEHAVPAQGVWRCAILEGGIVDAVLLLSAAPAISLPDRSEIAALLGCSKQQTERNGIFTGKVRAPVAAAGATICACFQVGVNTLRQAIVSQKLTSVAEIGAALRAGTNCGSCIPELSRILRQPAKSA